VCRRPFPSQLSVYELDEAVEDHTQPEVHQEAQVNAIGTMLAGRRQVGQEQEKIHQVAQ